MTDQEGAGVENEIQLQEVPTSEDAVHPQEELPLEIVSEEIVEALRRDQIIQPINSNNFNKINTTPSKKRTRNCEICDSVDPKYCCPGCSMRTCSLQCVKKHKLDTGCTGKKVCTFVPTTEMDDNLLRADYFFIKEGERLAGESFRISSRQSRKSKRAQLVGGRGDKMTEDEHKDDEDIESRSWSSHTALPMALRKLVLEAGSRGVTLRLMPRGMTRRRLNTTFYAYRTQKFYWRIEWILNDFLGESQSIKLLADRVDDGTLLKESLQTLIENIISKTNEADSPFNRSQKKFLRTKCSGYLKYPADELYVLMHQLHTPANNKQYHRLDLNKTIAENLNGKTVLEYPTFTIVPPNLIESYTLIEPKVNTTEIMPTNKSGEQSHSYGNILAAALQKDVMKQADIDGVPMEGENPQPSN